VNIGFTSQVLKELGKIKKKDKILFSVIQKQLDFFALNQKHPSLRIHKLSGKHKNSWSLTVTDSLRMIYYIENGGKVVFCDIGTHGQVYREN